MLQFWYQTYCSISVALSVQSGGAKVLFVYYYWLGEGGVINNERSSAYLHSVNHKVYLHLTGDNVVFSVKLKYFRQGNSSQIRPIRVLLQSILPHNCEEIDRLPDLLLHFVFAITKLNLFENEKTVEDEEVNLYSEQEHVATLHIQV